MRPQANRVDQNKIKKLMKQDHSAEEISHMLNIELSCVGSFVEHFEAEVIEELENQEEILEDKDDDSED